MKYWNDLPIYVNLYFKAEIDLIMNKLNLTIMAIYCYIFVIKLLMRWTEMLKFNERRKKLTSHTHTQKKDTRRLFKDNDHNNKISIILTRFLMARMWAWRAQKTIPISTCEVSNVYHRRSINLNCHDTDLPSKLFLSLLALV